MCVCIKQETIIDKNAKELQKPMDSTIEGFAKYTSGDVDDDIDATDWVGSSSSQLMLHLLLLLPSLVLVLQPDHWIRARRIGMVEPQGSPKSKSCGFVQVSG